MKRVMVDQGSKVEIIYPDLYKRLELKLKDLSKYDVPRVEFDKTKMIPKGTTRLSVQMGSKVVKVYFIVVDAYSLYTTILARSWLNAMGAISSTLHVKLKFPTEGHVGKLLGCQTMAGQCIVAVVRHQTLLISHLDLNPTS